MHVGESANKKGVLEELLEMGMVLVALDARADGVDVPDHLGRDPQLRLNLSFRFGLPMALDPWGITATLTFGGVPYACRFPWTAIYLLVSHVNGEPYLFPDEVPPELLAQVGVESAWSIQPSPKARPTGRPKLSVVAPLPEAEDEEEGEEDGDENDQDGANERAKPEARTDSAPARPAKIAELPDDEGEGEGEGKDAPDAPPRAKSPATARRAGSLRPSSAHLLSQSHANPPLQAGDKRKPTLAAAPDVPDDDHKDAGDAETNETNKPKGDKASDEDGQPDPTPARRRGHLRLVK